MSKNGSIPTVQLSGPKSEQAALELLGQCQEFLSDLVAGDAIDEQRVNKLHDDIALAATHFGWWLEFDDDADPVPA